MSSLQIRWGLYFRLAWRNIWRRKIRTLITTLSISLGTGMLIFVIAFGDGFKKDMYQRYTGVWVGHAQIHGEGYNPAASSYPLIGSEYPLTQEDLEAGEHIVAASPRLFADGLLSIGSRRSPVRIIGVSLEGEKAVARWWRGLRDGELVLGERGLLLGYKVAEELEVAVGDKLVLSTSQHDGSGLASRSLKVAGILKTGVAALDELGGVLTLRGFREATGVSHGVHEWVVKTDLLDREYRLDTETLVATTPPLKSSSEALVVESWDEVQAGSRLIFEMQEKFVWIMIFAILVVVSLGVLNAITMSFLERTSEVGVMRALGTRASEMGWMVFFEGCLLALLGVLGACTLAALFIFGVFRRGIDLGSDAEFQGLVLSDAIIPVLNIEMTLMILALTIVFVLGSAFLVVRRAVQLQPIDALTRRKESG